MAHKTPITDWRKQRLLEWLCTIVDDRMPATLHELADELGTTRRQLTEWKADTDFLAEWEHQYRRTVGSPEKAQTIMQRLYETGTDRTDPRQVQAAKTYLEAIDAVKPRRVDVTVTQNRVRELSDDELLAMLAERASLELDQRQVEDA